MGHELLGEVVAVGLGGGARARLSARRHRLDREPHRLRHLLPVPDRRQPRLRRQPHHRHLHRRLLRRVREAPGARALAHRHADDPPRGRRAAGALRQRRPRVHEGEPPRQARRHHRLRHHRPLRGRGRQGARRAHASSASSRCPRTPRWPRRLGADHVLAPKNLDAPDATRTTPSWRARSARSPTASGVDVALEMSGQPSQREQRHRLRAPRRRRHPLRAEERRSDHRGLRPGHRRRHLAPLASSGRRIFETWHITRHLLETRRPEHPRPDLGRHPATRRGDGHRLPRVRAAKFEDRIKTFPKVVLKFPE